MGDGSGVGIRIDEGGGNRRPTARVGWPHLAAVALAVVLPLLALASVVCATANGPWRAIPAELWGVAPLLIGAWVALPLLAGWRLRTWVWPALCLGAPVLTLMGWNGGMPLLGPGQQAGTAPSSGWPPELPAGAFVTLGLVAAVAGAAGVVAGRAGWPLPKAGHLAWRLLSVAAVVPVVVATTVVRLVPAVGQSRWLEVLVATGMAAAWLAAPAVVGFLGRGWWWPPALFAATIASLAAWSVPWTLGHPYRFHATSWTELVVVLEGGMGALAAAVAALVGVAAGRLVDRRRSVADAGQGRDNAPGKADDPAALPAVPGITTEGSPHA